jgi:hypothetical protein
MADSIKITLELADKAAQQSLSDFVNKATQADKAVKKLGDSGAQSFGGLSVNIGRALSTFDVFAANLASNLVTKALEELGSLAHQAFDVFVVEGVKAAEEAETALNSLNVALAQSGHYSEAASKEFQEFAKTLQQTTTVEDDAIIKNAALLESMAHLDNDGLKRATKAALDLSAAFGIDLETATRTVAKAAEGNVTSLNKLGVAFEKGGSKAATFENALTAIESRLGGSAASKVNTYAGAVAQTKNEFNDLQESFGNVIVQNPVFISAIAAVGKILSQLSGYIDENKQSISELLGKGFIGLIDGAKYVVGAFDFIYRAAKFAFDGLKVVVYDTLASLLIPLALFSDTAKGVYKGLAEDSNAALKDMANAFEGESPLDAIGSGLDEIGRAAETGFDKLASGAKSAVPALTNIKAPLIELTDLQKQYNQATEAFVQSLVGQSVAVQANYDEQLNALETFYDNRRAVASQSEQENAALQRDLTLAEIAGKQTLLDQEYEAEQARIDASTHSLEEKNIARLQIEKKFMANKEKLNIQREKTEQTFETQRQKNFESTLGVISTLQQSGSKELFAIGKAAAIAQATIDGYRAVSTALASAPVPFNFALAALVGVATAANLAKIASASPPAFETGGIVPGASYSGDKVPALVNSGEMILNRTQQAKLFDIANGQGNADSNNGGLANTLASAIEKMSSQPIVVNVDGRELFNVFRSGLNSGRSLT